MFRFLVNLVAAFLVLYNTYNSFAHRKGDKYAKKQYSHYFKIMCIYLVVENLFSGVLKFVPYYQFFRLLTLLWLSIPSCSGSEFIYRFYVSGLVKLYHDDLDIYFKRIAKNFEDLVRKYYMFTNKKYMILKEKAKRKVFSKGPKHADDSIDASFNSDTTGITEKQDQTDMGNGKIVDSSLEGSSDNSKSAPENASDADKNAIASTDNIGSSCSDAPLTSVSDAKYLDVKTDATM